MKYELGSSFSFSLIWFLFIITATLGFVALSNDYYQVVQVKDTVDREFKRALNQGMIQYANDYFSSDYLAKMEPADVANLKNKIQNDFVTTLKNKYNIEIDITNFEMQEDGRVKCLYQGTVPYYPVVSRGLIKFDLSVYGRSKIQRIDLE